MRDAIFHLKRNRNVSLQAQIRETLVDAILAGQLLGGEPLPSSRRMAENLGVSRNTVVLAYQNLVDDGYLIPRERSGYYVNEEMCGQAVPPPAARPHEPETAPDWDARFRVHPSRQENIEKTIDWPSYPYPFVYGQVDQQLFPLAAWRECARQALGRRAMDAWTGDRLIHDDPMLIEQIRTHILPRRGINANADEILVTLGAQNALYIVASLLFTEDTTVGVEDPGYPDFFNIAKLKTGRVKAIPVDHHGLPADARIDGCDYLYVTPSHQFPTTVTMPMARREELLARAEREDIILIEDDYEFETNYVGRQTPALKSMDDAGRVIYVGSLSKSLFPGLRLGYMVASKRLIEEARALRRLMLRHPPTVNQRQTALFLSLGHHDALIHRLHREFRTRWEAMDHALQHYLPASATKPGFGGTAFWVRGPDKLDALELAGRAKSEGVLIEPGRVHFLGEDRPRNYFRLAFSSLPTERIEPGIRILSELIYGFGRL
ncbi:MAG: PLP-dependent aminotransferase family protein [Rhodospirillales bacterium]|nr:PLP-dependent aminotransferase family protein [Rhodospirillales bacterium]